MDPIAPDGAIDWTALARELGTLTPSGERGGTDEARAALSILLGSREIVLAVDHYVEQRPGSELARSVLSLLRPSAAMFECHRIYRESEGVERRRAAVDLLRDVADRRVLAWIEQFLGDGDEGIRVWGIGVLDQLVWRDLVDGEESTVEALLRRAEADGSGEVRSRADWIRSALGRRAAPR